MQSVFEIYNMTKDKGDFVENIKLIYNRCYKRNEINFLYVFLYIFLENFKNIVNRIADEMKMTQMEVKKINIKKMN